MDSKEVRKSTERVAGEKVQAERRARAEALGAGELVGW